MKDISRESLYLNSFTCIITLFLNRGACFTFLIIPAVFFSCTMSERLPHKDIDSKVLHNSVTKVLLQESDILTLDAFAFEKNGKLECYQRLENPDQFCEIASGSGEKQLLLIANGNKDIYEWADIRSLASAADIHANLEDEAREHPIMTSLQTITAGQDTSVDLLPLRCEIILRSLRCDFSGKPYHDQLLTDIKIYLSYINASCSIVPPQRIMPSRIIGAGILDKQQLNCFREKEIIWSEIAESVGKETVQINKSLFCYANEPVEESIGSPFTRLVIEGSIGGNTYYYPIKINSRKGGIARGCRYVFDVILTKTGATDPDGELAEEDMEVKMEVMKWREKDWYTVSF